MKSKTLVHLTLFLVRRRLALYAVAVAVALGLQAAIIALAHMKHADLAASAIVLPALATLIYAFVAADALDEEAGSATWSRILERVWAVIAINFLNSAFTVLSLGIASVGSLTGMVAGSGLQMLVALMAFVDVIAVLDNEDRWFALVPRSYARGFALALGRGNLWRCFIVYALSLVALAIESGLEALLLRIGAPSAAFWAPLVLGTILALPICAFTVVVYFDAAGIRIPVLAADDTVQ